MASLTTEQYTAIEWLSKPKRGGKTYEQIAEICEVHRSTLFEWKKNATFEAELKRQMIRNSQDKLPDLIESMPMIAMRDGNAAMFKLLLQLNGLLTDKIEVDTKDTGSVNIDLLMERIRQAKEKQSDAVE